MDKTFYISQWVVIENGVVSQNGTDFFRSTNQENTVFSKELYQFLKLNYPKFFKMDDLSKWAVLGTEILLKNETSKNIALLFSNASASLHTDVKHQQSIQSQDDYYPSPAVFVYTLPNICIGEVSIKHKLQSESVFLVSSKFDTQTLYHYTEYLLQHNKAEKVLCGWVEVFNSNYKFVFYLVEQSGIKAHTQTEINHIIT